MSIVFELIDDLNDEEGHDHDQDQKQYDGSNAKDHVAAAFFAFLRLRLLSGRNTLVHIALLNVGRRKASTLHIHIASILFGSGFCLAGFYIAANRAL